MELAMQMLIVVLATAVTLLALPSPRAASADPLLVRAVIDGATIDLATIGRVRLLGIDAPALGRRFDRAAPFAREARDRLASLVLRRWIRLEQDGNGMDTYRRRLAYVMLEDGLFVNAALVREGLARVSARAPLRRLGELQRAEADAQAFRRGIWGATPQTPPAGYTRPASGARSPNSRPSTARPSRSKTKSKSKT
jgi:endonuclease YncB( thermonuclease family)